MHSRFSTAFRADSWSRVKYANLDSFRYGLWDGCPDYSRGGGSECATSHSAFRRGLLTPFFIRPKIVVSVTRPLPVPDDLWAFGGAFANPELKHQSLIITPKNYSGSLSAIVRVDSDEEPANLGWRHAQSAVRIAPVISPQIIGTDTGKTVFDGEESTLPVWYAYKTRQRADNFGEIMEVVQAKQAIQEDFTVFFNTVGAIRVFDPKEVQSELRPTGNLYYVDLTIRFAPLDKKPRNYRLNVSSWDELNLTVRD